MHICTLYGNVVQTTDDCFDGALGYASEVYTWFRFTINALLHINVNFML